MPPCVLVGGYMLPCVCICLPVCVTRRMCTVCTTLFGRFEHNDAQRASLSPRMREAQRGAFYPPGYERGNNEARSIFLLVRKRGNEARTIGPQPVGRHLEVPSNRCLFLDIREHKVDKCAECADQAARGPRWEDV